MQRSNGAQPGGQPGFHCERRQDKEREECGQDCSGAEGQTVPHGLRCFGGPAEQAGKAENNRADQRRKLPFFAA